VTRSTTQSAWSLRTYRAAVGVLKPLANYTLVRRLRAGKEDPERIEERRGRAVRPRPEGQIVWIHGASVGESLSILPLIECLEDRYPAAHFVVTTGTVTSARLMSERLPDRAIHQYAPIDQPDFVQSFFDHWRPDVGIFVESELWPIMIGEARSRGIPLALVNGRLSPRSYRGWLRRRGAVRELLSAFEIILAQDEANATRLSDLAEREVVMAGNLKAAAPPLPTDELGLARLVRAVGERPVWLAASTHPGEEERVIDAHRQLVASLPDLLTVIVPRHPDRGNEVEALLTQGDLTVRRRSKGDVPDDDTAVYLADTMGELGIFYRLSDVAFIGGSLTPVGGHNPMEPARLGSAIVTGPHVFNFEDTFLSMRRAGALALVRNERDLAASLLRLLTDARTREEMASHARNWADRGAMQVLDEIVTALHPVLSRLDKAA
jgi:3-deoxy-D-manno-octulosonic-acid transferase